MKFIITRIDYNSVKAEVEGYYPLKGTYERFFDELNGYIKNPGYVKSLEYKDHTIYIEKYDQTYGYLFTDSYVLDGLLESDARFMEYLNKLLAEYESIKDNLRQAIEEKIENRNFNMEASKEAIQIYKAYCETGELRPISSEKLVRRVIELFSANAYHIYTNISTTMEGDIILKPQVSFNTPKLKKLKIATGVSGVATAALTIATLIFPNPITAFSGLATGIGCYCTNERKKESNNEMARKTLTELAETYKKLYPEVEPEEGPKLIKQ